MRKFDAILINSKSIDSSRISGEISINEDGISFSGNEQTFFIPFNELEITLGGAGNKLIFFTYLKDTSYSLYTSNQQILKQEQFLHHPRLSQQLKTIHRKKRGMLSSFLIVIALFVGIILSLFFAKDYFVRKLAEQAPVEWENKIGDKLFQGLSMQYTFIKNDSLTTVFKQVAAPLFQQIEKDGVKIDLYFTKDPTINAFALPGGKVIIQTGLIEKAKSWEEVLGVLGHELAHVTQRHHLRGVINNLGLYAVISAFFGDISAIAGTIANTGGELASLSNSRTFETEADEVGMQYLVQAKINNAGLISFFKTLKKEHSNQLEKQLAILSTHPATDDRIEHLIKLQKEIPVYKPIKFNVSFEAFQQAIEKQ